MLRTVVRCWCLIALLWVPSCGAIMSGETCDWATELEMAELESVTLGAADTPSPFCSSSSPDSWYFITSEIPPLNEVEDWLAENGWVEVQASESADGGSRSVCYSSNIAGREKIGVSVTQRLVDGPGGPAGSIRGGAILWREVPQGIRTC